MAKTLKVTKACECLFTAGSECDGDADAGRVGEGPRLQYHQGAVRRHQHTQYPGQDTLAAAAQPLG